MSIEAKKMAAAMAAVGEYLREEETAAASAAKVRAPEGPSLWALSGRQEIINMRSLVIARLWR